VVSAGSQIIPPSNFGYAGTLSKIIYPPNMFRKKSSKAIKKRLSEITKEFEEHSFVLEKRFPEFLLGANELQGRWLIKTTVLTILIASLSLFISYQAFQISLNSTISNKENINKQTEILNEIKNKNPELNEQLEKIIFILEENQMKSNGAK